MPLKDGPDSTANAGMAETVPSKQRVDRVSKDKGTTSKAQPRPRSKKRISKATPTASTSTKTTTTAAAIPQVKAPKSTTISSSSAAASSSKTKATRVLSDEDVVSSEEEGEQEEEEEEDIDHQLGLRPTLRVVSKATVKRTWKPVSVKTRTHVQMLMSGLFP